MKKVLLSSLLVAGIFTTQAQIKQGTFAVGGGIGLQLSGSSKKVDNGSTTTTPIASTIGFTIVPVAQYFVADNFSVGLQLGFGSNTYTTKGTNNNPDVSNSNTTFSIAPMARYYYMLDENVGFFGQGALSFASQSNSVSSGGTSSTDGQPTVSTFGFGISPGLIFFPGKKIGIEATLGNLLAIQAISSQTKTGGTTTTNTNTAVDILNVNTLGLALGFQYYFGR